MSGARLPLDPAFVDFLHFARIQPGQFHSNATRTVFALIVLCRRLGVERTSNIIRTYLTPLLHTGSTLFLRARKNKVILFYASPNKVY